MRAPGKFRVVVCLGCITLSPIIAAADEAPEEPTEGRIVIKEFDADDLLTLDLRNSSGNTHIKGEDVSKFIVRAEKSEGDRCDISMGRKGNVLEVLALGKSTGWFGRRSPCVVNIDVSMPKNLSLRLHVGAGNIDISDTSGHLDVKIGSGNLTASIDSQNVNAKIGSGDVAVEGLTGAATVRTGSGTTKLSWKEVPDKGSSDIKVGSGTVSLFLPKETSLRTSFDIGNGSLSSDFPETGNAAFEITGVVGNGQVQIRKLPQ